MTTSLGKPVTLVGQRLQTGEAAPDFTLTTADLTRESLSDFAGKKKVINIIPSTNTGVCSTQTRTSDKELSNMGDTIVITVSAGLPFARARWCDIEGLERTMMISNCYDNTFGKTYGLSMKEQHLLARAVLILGEDNKLVYVEYFGSVSSEPNYQAAIGTIKAL